MIAQKYLESLVSIASGAEKIVFLPYEASGVMASLGGIKELLAQQAKAGRAIQKDPPFVLSHLLRGRRTTAIPAPRYCGKLIGGLGSPCACSLIGAESYFLYSGVPIKTVSPFSSK